MADLPKGGAAKDGGSLADQVHENLKKEAEKQQEADSQGR